VPIAPHQINFEERALLERYPQEYKAYMGRVKKLLPLLF